MKFTMRIFKSTLVMFICMLPLGYAADHILPNDLLKETATVPSAQLIQAQTTAKQLVTMKNDLLLLSSEDLPSEQVVNDIYDAAGRLIRQEFYSGDSLQQTKEFIYNEYGALYYSFQSIFDVSSGNLVEKNGYSDGNFLIIKTTYAYNEFGDLVLKTEYDYDRTGMVFLTTQCIYQNVYSSLNGQLKEIYEYPQQEQLLKKTALNYNARGALIDKREYFFSYGGDLVFQTDSHYNPATGKIINWFWYSKKGTPLGSITYRYDSSGNLVSQNDFLYDEYGHLVARDVKVYDGPTGHILSYKTYDSRGKLIALSTYEYSVLGFLTSEVFVAYDPRSGEPIVQGSRIYDASNGNFIEEYSYAKEILVVKRIATYDSSGKLLSINDCVYDSTTGAQLYRIESIHEPPTGRLVQNSIYNGDDQLLERRTFIYDNTSTLQANYMNLCQYDSAGQLLKRYEEFYENATGRWLETKEYNSADELVLRTVYTYDPETRELKQLDEYDGQGNLIRTVYF